MLPLRLFRSRAFSLVNVVAFLFSVGVFGSVFLLAQFFQVVQGLGPFGSGSAHAAMDRGADGGRPDRRACWSAGSAAGC